MTCNCRDLYHGSGLLRFIKCVLHEPEKLHQRWLEWRLGAMHDLGEPLAAKNSRHIDPEMEGWGAALQGNDHVEFPDAHEPESLAEARTPETLRKHGSI